jgi:hypothetical protein
VVAFLDDDARVAPDWLERLAGGNRSEEMVGVGAAGAARLRVGAHSLAAAGV